MTTVVILFFFQSKILVLFSGSQSESAQILFALAAKEGRKGYSLPCPLSLTPNAEKVLPFYQSLPGVGFGTALLLAANFKSVKDFVNAAQVGIFLLRLFLRTSLHLVEQCKVDKN